MPASLFELQDSGQTSSSESGEVNAEESSTESEATTNVCSRKILVGKTCGCDKCKNFFGQVKQFMIFFFQNKAKNNYT